MSRARPRGRRPHGRHGEAAIGHVTPEYHAWLAMRQRCVNPEPKDVETYRGVRVHPRWDSFENFLADVGRRPSPKHSLDRFPDAHGNYEPGNVRWATPSEQSSNRPGFVHALTFQGRTQTASQWARELGMKPCTLLMRLYRGWTVERALTP